MLDCVGDIGGLYDGLMILFGFFLHVYNANLFDLVKVKNLFKFKKTPRHKFSKIKKISKQDVITIT